MYRLCNITLTIIKQIFVLFCSNAQRASKALRSSSRYKLRVKSGEARREKDLSCAARQPDPQVRRADSSNGWLVAVCALIVVCILVLFVAGGVGKCNIWLLYMSCPRFKNRLLADPGTPGTLRVWCRVCVSAE